VQHHSPHIQQLPTQQYQDTQGHPAPVNQNYQAQRLTPSLIPPVDSLSPPHSVTPSPSPLIDSTDFSCSPRSPRSPPLPQHNSRTSRKRRNTDISSSGSGSDSDSSEVNPRYRIRRTSHHDRRCLTIHVSSRFLRFVSSRLNNPC
jgi:hypothetical protein